MIPILEANLDNYIKFSIYELITLLHNRQSNIPGSSSSVGRNTLIKLTTIVGTNSGHTQNDNSTHTTKVTKLKPRTTTTNEDTTSMKQIHQSPSMTSEGAGWQYDVKITPMSYQPFLDPLTTIIEQDSNLNVPHKYLPSIIQRDFDQLNYISFNDDFNTDFLLKGSRPKIFTNNLNGMV